MKDLMPSSSKPLWHILTCLRAQAIAHMLPLSCHRILRCSVSTKPRSGVFSCFLNVSKGHQRTHTHKQLHPLHDSTCYATKWMSWVICISSGLTILTWWPCILHTCTSMHKSNSHFTYFTVGRCSVSRYVGWCPRCKLLTSLGDEHLDVLQSVEAFAWPHHESSWYI